MRFKINDRCYADVRGTVLEGTIIGDNDVNGTMQFRSDNLPLTSEGFPVERGSLFETLEDAIDHCRNRAGVYEWEADRLEIALYLIEAAKEEQHFDDVMEAQRDKTN